MAPRHAQCNPNSTESKLRQRTPWISTVERLYTWALLYYIHSLVPIAEVPIYSQAARPTERLRTTEEIDTVAGGAIDQPPLCGAQWHPRPHEPWISVKWPWLQQTAVITRAAGTKFYLGYQKMSPSFEHSSGWWISEQDSSQNYPKFSNPSTICWRKTYNGLGPSHKRQHFVKSNQWSASTANWRSSTLNSQSTWRMMPVIMVWALYYCKTTSPSPTLVDLSQIASATMLR